MRLDKIMGLAGMLGGSKKKKGKMDMLAAGVQLFNEVQGKKAAAPQPAAAKPATPAPAADTLDADEWALLRIMVAAAQADGNVSDNERTSILTKARELGANRTQIDQLGRELKHPVPVEDIVSKVDSIAARKLMYQCAVAIVRADAGTDQGEIKLLNRLAAATELHYDVLAKLVS